IEVESQKSKVESHRTIHMTYHRPLTFDPRRRRDPMEIFLQQLINGIVLGSIYALIALGYTMVYGVLRLINFAHGDVFMIGAFIGFYSARALNINNPSFLGAILVTSIAMAGAGSFSVLIVHIAYRARRKS